MRRRSAVLGCVAALALSGGVSALAFDRTAVHYAGQGVADPETTIETVVISRGDRRVDAKFTARNVVYVCDDGSVGRRDLPSMKFKFKTRNTFHERNVDSVSPELGTGYSYEVKGRLSEDGGAAGWLTYKVRQARPAPPGVPEVPECHTPGRIHWTATQG